MKILDLFAKARIGVGFECRGDTLTFVVAAVKVKGVLDGTQYSS